MVNYYCHLYPTSSANAKPLTKLTLDKVKFK